jgi:DNA invertase Pin-like site-specific DNA recombinase
MLQAVHGWSSAYERLVKSQKFFSSYLTQEDMSRLGRDYLKVGQVMEILRQKGVRLIAINDGVDSLNGDDDFTPFRNIMKNIGYLRRVFC